MANDAPEPEPPEGYEIGSFEDATVDKSATRTVWVTTGDPDEDDEARAYWFELKADVPLRKKNEVLENNLTISEGDDGSPQQSLSSDYYTDMLEYMVVDWFGAHEDGVPGLATFLSSMSTDFEALTEEVPDPFGAGSGEDRGK
jgi:hypothetical protein